MHCQFDKLSAIFFSDLIVFESYPKNWIVLCSYNLTRFLCEFHRIFFLLRVLLLGYFLIYKDIFFHERSIRNVSIALKKTPSKNDRKISFGLLMRKLGIFQYFNCINRRDWKNVLRQLQRLYWTAYINLWF